MAIVSLGTYPDNREHYTLLRKSVQLLFCPTFVTYSSYKVNDVKWKDSQDQNLFVAPKLRPPPPPKEKRLTTAGHKY